MGDPYLQKNGTLRNRLAITDPGLLQNSETEWYHMRLQGFRSNEPGAFEEIESQVGWGLAKLKAIHKHLFGDVYDWAGKTRIEPFTDSTTGKLVKPNFATRKTGMRKAFTAPGGIAEAMGRVEASIVVGRTRDLGGLPEGDAYDAKISFRPRGKPTPGSVRPEGQGR